MKCHQLDDIAEGCPRLRQNLSYVFECDPRLGVDAHGWLLMLVETDLTGYPDHLADPHTL